MSECAVYVLAAVGSSLNFLRPLSYFAAEFPAISASGTSPRVHTSRCWSDITVPKEILKERYATQVDEDYQQNMTEAPSAELEEPVEPSEMEARDVPSVDESEY